MTAGPNKGAALVLAPGQYSVGAGPGNDIVLADGSVAAEQISLDIGSARAAVMALSPGVSIRRARLNVGRRRALRPGAELQLGQTSLRFNGPAPRQSRPWAGRATLLAGLFLAGIATSAGAYRTANPLPKPARAAAAVAARGPGITAEQAAALLGDHLREIGIGDAVRVSANGGAVLAEGVLLPADQPRWDAAQRWFDSRLASSVALMATIRKAEAASLPSLDIAAVGLAPVPHVITRGGERYMQGAVLPGGWIITAITASRVTLADGSREIGITL